MPAVDSITVPEGGSRIRRQPGAAAARDSSHVGVLFEQTVGIAPRDSDAYYIHKLMGESRSRLRGHRHRRSSTI